MDEDKTPESSVIRYNNFYEFTTDKEAVAQAAADFNTDGWQIVIDGLVNKPQTLTIDSLHAISKPQERIYRMRCVEAWSMVIPWVGVPLAHVLEAVEPQSSAKYVAFETLLDPVRMPGQQTDVLEWPYAEGLRLDEAMNPLAILATGLYGKMLPPQDGVRATLQGLGIPHDQIRTEVFSGRKSSLSSEPAKGDNLLSAKSGEAAPMKVVATTIQFVHSQRAIPCEPGMSVLEAAEQCGIEIPFECRSGICGQCKVKGLSGGVRMDCEGALSRSEKSEGYILACQAHPTSNITIEY